MKRTAAIILIFIAVLSGVLFCLHSASKPPSDDQLIEDFHTHRMAYEQLREMLASDKKVIRVAKWGVQTVDSPLSKIPPDGGVSISRYEQYLVLMKDTGAIVLYRDTNEGQRSDVEIMVWASGWAGDTRHIAICYVENEPPNEVSSLEEFYKTPKPRNPVFRHIEGKWYLWADW